VQFFNPHATGRLQNHNGTWQWIDLVASDPDLGLVAIDIREKDSRFAKRFADEKRAGLTDRGIPYLVLKPAGLWDLEVEMIVWLREMKELLKP
jgi:hypothetical protein